MIKESVSQEYMPDTSIAGMAIPIVVAIRITQGIRDIPNRDQSL